MQRTNVQDDPGVPLQSFEWENRNQQSTVPPAERDGYKDFEKIDVHNFTGLATILAVNVQQLYLLISVGPELGAMFYVLISITSVSAIFVVRFCLVLRRMLRLVEMRFVGFSPAHSVGAGSMQEDSGSSHVDLVVLHELGAERADLCAQPGSSNLRPNDGKVPGAAKSTAARGRQG